MAKIVAKKVAALLVLCLAMTMLGATIYGRTAETECIQPAAESVVETQPPKPVLMECKVMLSPSPEPVVMNEQPEPELPYTESDVIALAQMAYGEADITQSDTEMSATMWCALNRYDSDEPFFDGYRGSIYEIISQPLQFHGYSPDNAVTDRLEILARDVLGRWTAEKAGETDVGRTLPKEYLFFTGDGRHNHFTTVYQGEIEYDWSLESPYDT